METADKWRDANPWTPMSKTIDIKHIGKLGRAGELSTSIFRCLIQGIDESEPVTGKINRQWLEDEIADVLANIDLCVSHFKLKIDHNRILRKKEHLKKWHSMLD